MSTTEMRATAASVSPIDRHRRAAYLFSMRQSWYFRLLGLILLPLYSTGAWIAPALQVCPMHGSPQAAHASMVMAEAMDPGHVATGESVSTTVAEDMSGHAAHMAKVSATKASNLSASASEAPATSHTHGCDCLGCCAGSNGPAVPTPQLASVDVVVTPHEAIELKNAEVVVLHFAHVLPFATAPPNTLV